MFSLKILVILGSLNLTFLMVETTPAQLPSTSRGCPPIVTRAEWGARSPRAVSTLREPVKYLFIHHSATRGCTSQSVCSALMRSFQNNHMDNKKWSDIGYSFVIGGDGQVYEGRGWGRIGAHTKGQNSVSYGIGFIGNYMSSNPSAKMIAAYERLQECAVSEGHTRSSWVLCGHRDVRATACPGDYFYENYVKRHSNYGPCPGSTSTTSPQPCPTIVTRAEWGARRPRSVSSLRDPVPYLFTHHTVTPQCSTKSACIARRWSDIGYSFLIGGDGRVYEGRGWKRVGAHTGGYNSVGYGVSFIGTFTSAYPNQAMIATYERFQRCAEKDGHLRSSWRLCGHRDVSTTACPGTRFWTEYVKRHPKYGPCP